MKIMLTSRHGPVSEKVKHYTIKKMEKLERFFESIISCDIVFDKEQSSKNVEVRLKVYGNTLIVKEKSDDHLKSVDIAADKLERQLKKYKDKLRAKSNTRTVEALTLDNTDQYEEENI